jgi:hypothetical protein
MTLVQMTVGITSGLNRLFVVLTFGWVIYCAVIFPMQHQWEGQQRVFDANRNEVKNCDELIKEAPAWDMMQDCYKRADENRNAMLDEYSLGHFWMLDIVFWKLLIPVIVLPPIIVFAIAMIGKWVWKGFNATSEG